MAGLVFGSGPRSTYSLTSPIAMTRAEPHLGRLRGVSWSELRVNKKGRLLNGHLAWREALGIGRGIVRIRLEYVHAAMSRYKDEWVPGLHPGDLRTRPK